MKQASTNTVKCDRNVAGAKRPTTSSASAPTPKVIASDFAAIGSLAPCPWPLGAGAATAAGGFGGATGSFKGGAGQFDASEPAQDHAAPGQGRGILRLCGQHRFERRQGFWQQSGRIQRDGEVEPRRNIIRIAGDRLAITVDSFLVPVQRCEHQPGIVVRLADCGIEGGNLAETR